MKLYIVINSDNRVVATSTTFISMGNFTTVDTDVPPDHEVLNNPSAYVYRNNELVKDDIYLSEHAKQEKINELNEKCTNTIHTGFESGGNSYQFNEQDQANFNQQLCLLLLDATVNQVAWKTENNGIQTLTREQFIEACKAGEVHKRNNISHYWQLKTYVMTHTFSSVEEINAIDFSFVVPTGA